MADAALEGEVKRFVSEFFACRPERLTPTTRLFHDLGVDGADGWEFMAAFGQRFEVNMGEFFAALHFNDEGGCNPVLVLLWLLYRPRFLRLVPITLGDLVEAARSKQWQTPNREPE